MKRIICCMLTLFMLLAGCTGLEAAPTSTTDAAPALSVEKTVLFESPYVTVSTQGITQEGSQYKLELLVSNTGTADMDVSEQNTAVNGLTVPAECSGYFPSRVTGTVGLSMDCSTVFSWGMDKLETVTFTLCLKTQYSYDAVPVTVRVFQEGSCGTLNEGTTILDENGVKVQYKIVDNWPVYLLVNNSDKSVIIRNKEFTLNGITENYLDGRWYTAEPGQRIVTAPERPYNTYIPKTDMLQVAFRVYVYATDKTFQYDSAPVTYEAPFFMDNCGLSEEFVTVFDNGKVKISLGTAQRSSEKAADLCIWICNDSDEELVVTVPALEIDGRKIPVYDPDKNQDQCYYKMHTVKPHTQDILALTYGECGTPEMYGGIREVYLPMSIFLGDEPQTVEKYDSTIEFP